MCERIYEYILRIQILCFPLQPEYNERKQYSSHVTNLKFVFDDSYIISTGGIDASLMQWALVDVQTPR